MVAEQLETERLVFVDEMGTNTSLSAVYAWAPKGQRAYCSVPRNRGANTTVLASMSVEGMGPSLTVEGATTSVVFEAYVEQVLAPSLRRGQVVVMDNPIEEAFSKIKRLACKAEARTREALVEAIGLALSAVSSKDARSFFEHCGYRMPVQSLW